MYREAVDSFRNGYTEVGVAATRAISTELPDGNYKGVLFKAPGVNDDASNTVAIYIGGIAVTADYDPVTGGFPLAPGESLTLPLESTDGLYAIASSSNQTLAWIMI